MFLHDTLERGAGMRSKLINARKKAGFTQNELARLASLNRAYYTNIEKGRRNPSIITAFRLAYTLNKPVEELFDDLIVTARG